MPFEAVFYLVAPFAVLLGLYFFSNRAADKAAREEVARTGTMTVPKPRSVWFYLSRIWLLWGTVLGIAILGIVMPDIIDGSASGDEYLAAAVVLVAFGFGIRRLVQIFQRRRLAATSLLIDNVGNGGSGGEHPQLGQSVRLVQPLPREDR